MKQRLLYLLFISIISLLIACRDGIEPGTETQISGVVKNVTTATAQLADQPIIYEAVGTVNAGISSKLSSKLLGVIEEIRVREGDRVKQGDILVKIDERSVIAGENQAEAALTEAKKSLNATMSARDTALATEELARTTLERYQVLKQENSVSRQEFDEVAARHQQAKAELGRLDAMIEADRARIAQAAAALDAARVVSRDAVISAPHDGIISGKMVDKGDLARPGTPLLVLETTQGFCIDVIVPETYIYKVEPGQKVSVSVPALETGPLDGNVCTIVPGGDPQSRSFVVKIKLPIDKQFKSGFFARARIPIGTVRKLLIPLRAVVNRGQLTGFYLVDKDNRARFRLLRTGKVMDDYVEVLSGLKEGDRFIVMPPEGLSDGDQVEEAR